MGTKYIRKKAVLQVVKFTFAKTKTKFCAGFKDANNRWSQMMFIDSKGQRFQMRDTEEEAQADLDSFAADYNLPISINNSTKRG